MKKRPRTDPKIKNKVLPLLGTRRDTEIAKKFGLKRQTVMAWRVEHGIGAWHKTIRPKSNEQTLSCWMPSHLIQKLSVVARVRNVSVSQVVREVLGAWFK